MFTTQTYDLKNGKQLIIREAQKADAQAILDYIDHVVGETDFLTFGPGEFGITVSQEETYIEKTQQSDNSLMLVAVIGEGIIGEGIIGVLTFTGAARSRVHHQGEMGITILREHWGLGIGTHLIESLITWARMGGIIRKINLRTREDNHRAIALYKRLGFIVQGTLTREFYVNGEFYSSLVMGLEID